MKIHSAKNIFSKPRGCPRAKCRCPESRQSQLFDASRDGGLGWLGRLIASGTTRSYNHQRPGQLLVEVLIGIGIIAILIAGIIPLILSSTNVSSREAKNTVASLLAKEQIEAAKAIQEEDWNSIYSANKGIANPYHLVVSSGKWKLESPAETVNLNGINFTKSIAIYNVSRTGSNGAGNIEPIYTPARDDPSTQKVVATVTGFGVLPITITEYFARGESQTWTQTDWQGGAGFATWQDPPGNRFFNGNDVDTSTIIGAVQLAKTGAGGTGNYGNRSLLTALPANGIGRMNSANLRSSMRFKAQKSGNVSSLRVYLQLAQNSGGIVYRYGLQADNAGNPSGVYLDSATAAFSSIGWKTINLGSPIAVTAGTTYHLVVQYVSGTINNSRYIAIRNSTPLNQLVPLNQIADNQQNTLWFNGTSWASQNQQPVYLLGFNDNTFEGNPFDSFQARSIYGANFEGEKFSLSADKTVNALNIYVSKNANQNPAAPLHVVLQDITANTNIIDTDFLSGVDVTTTYTWKTLNISPDLVLPANHQFRLYFSSAGSASNRYYRLYDISNPDTAEYNDNNWDGTTSVVSRSTDSGTNWAESNFIDLSGYYFTTVEAQSYALSGDLTSSTYDVGKKAGFNRISWTNIDLPANTTVRFQLAANNTDSWNPITDFKGPNGTTSDYYTFSTGENIWSGLANNRYLRYKLFLTTNSGSVTPILGEVKINLSP